MPLVCTHCSDSSGFFWGRCFGTRCASLCKRARRLLPASALFIFASPGIFAGPPGQMPTAFTFPCRAAPRAPAVPGRAPRVALPRERGTSTRARPLSPPPLSALPGGGRRKRRAEHDPSPGLRWDPPGVARSCSARGGPVAAMRCRVLMDPALQRWGRESFEWRWRAIALATAGCALPAPACERRAAATAAPSILAPRHPDSFSPCQPPSPRSPPCRG